MSVNIFDPHAPFDPPQSFLDRYVPDELPGPLFQESDLAAQDRLTGVDFQTAARRPEAFEAKDIQAAYYAMIELIDENVGRMLDTLERTGQRENTIVIFNSDHGEMLGDHGLLLKGCRFYEGLVRVPLIFSWPGHVARGVVSDALVELTDIVPTLMEACGLPMPARMQGCSLLPILSGEGDPHYHRDTVRCEYYRALNPDVPGRDDFEGTYATMIRDDRFKLVVYHGHDVGELFDLQADPGEFENLWDDPQYAEVRFRLMKASFDAMAFAVDVGTKQVAHY
jgi:arylsulfatase A-like enzyme